MQSDLEKVELSSSNNDSAMSNDEADDLEDHQDGGSS